MLIIRLGLLFVFCFLSAAVVAQKAIPMNRSNSILNGNVINSVKLFKDTLYIAGREGLHTHLPTTNYWRNLTPNTSLDTTKPFLYAYDTYLDQRNDLWMGTMINFFFGNYTYSGLLKLDRSTGSWVNQIDTAKPVNSQFQALHLEGRKSSSELYISYWYSYIGIKDLSTNSFSSIDPNANLRSDQATAIFFDPQDNLIVGTNAGLSFLDSGLWTKVDQINGQNVSYVHQIIRKPGTDTVFSATAGGLVSFGLNRSNARIQNATNSPYNLYLPWGASGVGFDSVGRKWICTTDSIIVDGCLGIKTYSLGAGNGGRITIDKHGIKWIAGGVSLIKFINLNAKIGATIAGGGNTICVGTRVPFRSLTTFICDSLATPTWDFGDGSPLVTATSTAHTFLTSGTFRVRLIARNRLGVTDTATFNLVVQGNSNVSPGQILVVGPSDSLCAGVVGPVLIAGLFAGDSTVWFLNGQRLTNTPTLQTNNPGQYILRSYFINCNQPVFKDDTLIIPARIAPMIAALAPDTIRYCKTSGQISPAIWLRLRRLSGSFSPTGLYLVTRNGNPFMTLQDDSLLVTSGVYAIRFINQTSSYCATSNTIRVVVLPDSLPSNLQLSSFGSRTLCGNDSLLLLATAGPYRYDWTRNNSPWPATGSSLTVKTAGVYRVTIRNATGCQQVITDSVVVSQQTAPTRPTIIGATSVCIGQPTTLRSNLGQGSRQWFRDNVPIVGATNDSLITAVDGQYQVQINLTGACNFTARSLIFGLVAEPLPIAPIILGDTIFCSGDSVLLSTALVPSARYNWYVGNTPINQQYRVMIKQAGNYVLEVALPPCFIVQSAPLWVIKTLNCTLAEPEIWVLPNVITPNQDGKNDVLHFGKSGYELSMFDRWGRQVYQSSSYDNTWGAGGLSGTNFFYYVKRQGKTYKAWLEVLR